MDGTETILYEGAEIVEITQEVTGEDAEDTAQEVAADPENANPSLKGSHIYSHDTYPFLYDARLLTFIFLAVSMVATFRGRSQKA